MSHLQSKQNSARAQAHGLLRLVLGEGLTLDEALLRTPLRGAETDQRFVMRLVRSTLQHLGQIDALLAHYIDKPLPAKRLGVSNALRLGVVQLLLLDTPAHAAVNETVSLVKNGADSALKGLVNAVLQKIVREQPALPPAIHNLPTWVQTRWEKAYGKAAVATMSDIAAQDVPLDLTKRDGTHERLAPDHPPVEQISGYADGMFIVQDIAASYPVRLLGDVRQLRVLDVCAAPGGKAAQLAWAGAEVTALDRSHYRLRRLQENMARLKLDVTVVQADALCWEPKAQYDAILLDAPCTATGTWRRHPEVVHRLKPKEIDEMAALQRQLLTRAWQWLRPEGRLVYCVCSLEPEEGEMQAEWFLSSTPEAVLMPPSSQVPAAYVTDAGFLRTRPDMMHAYGGMDGFFAAGWVKR